MADRLRLRPDDDVYRVHAVWLGPKGWTLPWTARYVAYGTWLVAFLTIIVIEALSPLNVGTPPVWEFCIATLATYAVMGWIDHDRPMSAVWAAARHEVRSPRATRTAIRRAVALDRVRVRELS